MLPMQVQLLGQSISVGRPSGYVDPSRAQEAAQAAAAALQAFQVLRTLAELLMACDGLGGWLGHAPCIFASHWNIVQGPQDRKLTPLRSVHHERGCCLTGRKALLQDTGQRLNFRKAHAL